MGRSRPPARRAVGVATLLLPAALVAGCSFGPRQLEQGHLAYNDAVRSAADDELLLNIVRTRYLDSLDFMQVASVSSQLAFTMSLGAIGGTETGKTTALGSGDLSYSTRPTFTFVPQRGRDFATQLVEPVEVADITYLVAADWDVHLLFRMLVRSLNDLDNELGLPNPRFREVTERLGEHQVRNQVFMGFVQAMKPLSDPIDPRQVSGTDLIEAAKAGYQFQRAAADRLVLSAPHPQPVIAFEKPDEDAEAIVRLLGLRPGRPLYPLEEGTRVGEVGGERDAITVRTRSILGTIFFLSQGVEVPEEHIEAGLTTREFPPGAVARHVEGLFAMRFSKKKPDASLRVKHRGYWFYVDESDMLSRLTFFFLAELVRLGLSESKAQEAPVLTLPVGAP